MSFQDPRVSETGGGSTTNNVLPPQSPTSQTAKYLQGFLTPDDIDQLAKRITSPADVKIQKAGAQATKDATVAKKQQQVVKLKSKNDVEVPSSSGLRGVRSTATTTKQDDFVAETAKRLLGQIYQKAKGRAATGMMSPPIARSGRRQQQQQQQQLTKTAQRLLGEIGHHGGKKTKRGKANNDDRIAKTAQRLLAQIRQSSQKS